MDSKFEKEALMLIEAERDEQKGKHGYTIERDRQYKDFELVDVAKCLLNMNDSRWPSSWSKFFYRKFMNKDRKGQLIVAGALMLAQKEAFKWDAGDAGVFEGIKKALVKELS
jgi:hypothetical protein